MEKQKHAEIRKHKLDRETHKYEQAIVGDGEIDTRNFETARV